jgi:hypothetical protein
MVFEDGNCIVCYCKGRRAINKDSEYSELFCFSCLEQLINRVSDPVKASLREKYCFNNICYHCGEKKLFLLITQLCEEHIHQLRYDDEDDEGDEGDDGEVDLELLEEMGIFEQKGIYELMVLLGQEEDL